MEREEAVQGFPDESLLGRDDRSMRSCRSSKPCVAPSTGVPHSRRSSAHMGRTPTTRHVAAATHLRPTTDLPVLLGWTRGDRQRSLRRCASFWVIACPSARKSTCFGTIADMEPCWQEAELRLLTGVDLPRRPPLGDRRRRKVAPLPRRCFVRESMRFASSNRSLATQISFVPSSTKTRARGGVTGRRRGRGRSKVHLLLPQHVARPGVEPTGVLSARAPGGGRVILVGGSAAPEHV